ncbi:MAG: TIGR03936 family radical SAM-associated protein [Actinobacteria bacterium]|nr:TIGR03936 family radical SAM-associated protein [Actinomycetota bacterium]
MLNITAENIIRFKFYKRAEYKFLSHLDIVRLITRALARSDIIVKYGKGFNPKPKISFSNPIPLGVESLAEYCDLVLEDNIEANDFISKVNLQLPEQLKIISARKVFYRVPSLMADIDLILYIFKINISGSTFDENFKAVNEKIIKLKERIEGENDFSKSIFKVDMELSDKNILFLKIFGYAKILKDANNFIFKFNNFLSFFSEILKESDFILDSVIKQEMYILQNNFQKNPLEVV